MVNFKKIFEYFIPEETHSESESYELIDYLSKLKLAVLLSIVYICVCSFLFIDFILVGIFAWSNLLLLLIPISLGWGLYILKVKGSFRFITWVFFVAFLVATPCVIYYMDGPKYPNFLWVGAGIITIGALFNEKTCIVYSVLSFISIVILRYLPDVTAASYGYVVTNIITDGLAFFSIMLSLLAILKRDEFIRSKTLEIEKLKTINLIATSLSHTVNNPLTVAKGNVIKIKNADSELVKSKINGSIDDIAKIVLKISRISDPDEIVSRPYLKIYKELNLKSNEE